MKKTTIAVFITAALMSLTSCSDKNTPSESTVVTTALPVTETATEPETEAETVPPRKKVEESDYFGKWIPNKIIVDEDVYEYTYMDIDLKYLYQLQINEDGTAEMGHSVPNCEKNSYNWLFISGMIEMNGESDMSVYGSMPYDELILTDGEGIKIYMEHTDEFEELPEIRYETAQDYNGDITFPELSVEKVDISSSEFVGKWECDFYETDGVVFRDEMYDMPLNALFRMELSTDGKAKFLVGGGDEDAIINDYTWELTANGCAVLCEDGESIGILRIKNDTLYLDESNEISHFHKVDEFSHFDWDSLADNASEQ